jgi:hypothetical protein
LLHCGGTEWRNNLVDRSVRWLGAPVGRPQPRPPRH